MGLFDDIFGGGGDLPDVTQHSDNPTSTPGTPASSPFDFSNMGSPTQHSDNPTSTPGSPSGSGFDWTSFAQSLSPTQHPDNPAGTPGVSAPIDLTSGAGAIPFGTAGGTNTPLSPTSAVGGMGYNSGANPASNAPGSSNQGTAPINDGTQKPAAAASGSSGGILASLGLGNASTADLLKGGVAGGGLLYSLFEGSPSASAEKQLKNIAGQQSAQGQQLESYINNGTLPPGAQQWVNQQTAGQKASIRAKYAQLGMNGSTAEQQELNNVDAQATSQMFTIASQLLNTGVSETNASGTLYNYLMQAQNADSKEMGDAIQNFVAAMGGGGSPAKKG